MDYINQKYNIPMQALGQSTLNANNASMQGLDAESVKQSVDNSYLSNRVKASSGDDVNPVVKGAATVGAWYGITQGMDVFNKKCAGEYEKSLFGKVGGFGDRVANTSVGKFIGNGLDKFSKFYDKLASKSKILYSLKHHSTQPEWGFAKMGTGIKGFYCGDLTQVLEEFVSPLSYDKGMGFIHHHSFQKLDQYGMTQEAIEAFKKSLSGMSHADKAIALQKKELELLKVPVQQIEKVFETGGLEALQDLAKRKKINRLGFKMTPEQFENLTKNAFDNLDEILKHLKTGVKKYGDLNISIWRNSGEAGKVTSHLFGRQIALSELINKGKVVTKGSAKSRLGRALTKSLAYLTEGTSCRFAGGKLVAVMQAALFGDMIAHAIFAPKGEKGKTFIERAVNDFSYFIAMPIGVLAMHKVGGMKYAGLDEKGVKAYRAALKAFNEKAAAAGFSTKAEYKTAKNALNDMLKANVKNPITRLFKNIGRLINIGNEARVGYVSKSAHNLNFLRKIPNFLKNCAGAPLRILIPIMLVSPFIAKTLTKGAHAIFGRPTKSVLDEEEEVNKEEQVQNTETVPLTNNDAQKTDAVQSSNPDNLVNMYKNGNPYNNHPVQEKPKDNYTYIPSPEGVKTNDGRPEALRTYVPNPAGVNIAPEDRTAADLAMSRADIAEKKAMETLAMKW